jgi:uncharacterized protein YlxW (UPF0749 family)
VVSTADELFAATRRFLASAKLSESNTQTRELDRATIRVANTTDMSGTATANEVNRDLRTGKERSLGRIARSTFFWSLIGAGLFIVLAPMPGRADNDRDIHPGREDNENGIRAEIAALEAQVASLQSTVSALEGQVSALQKANTGLQNEINSLQTSNAKLQNEVNSLQTSNTTLQNQLANAKNVLALDPFVCVDPNPEIGVIGPNITFTGANIHIVSGSGSTDDKGTPFGNGTPRGLGNLIIGYDEDPKNYFDSSPAGNLPLSPGDRGGSHNLVIGAANRFTQAAFGSLIVGTANTIKGYGASVSGGFSNTASGPFASVSGGSFNTAFQYYTSVSGGDSNSAGGRCSRFCGLGSSVSGGQGNTASGNYASISGGEGNTAFDDWTSVSGGSSNTAGSFVTFQGGLGASVSGGSGNTAAGRNTVVIGGQNVTDNKDNSIAPKPPFP